jgi:hypothetical protein
MVADYDIGTPQGSAGAPSQRRTGISLETYAGTPAHRWNPETLGDYTAARFDPGS